MCKCVTRLNHRICKSQCEERTESNVGVENTVEVATKAMQHSVQINVKLKSVISTVVFHGYIVTHRQTRIFTTQSNIQLSASFQYNNFIPQLLDLKLISYRYSCCSSSSSCSCWSDLFKKRLRQQGSIISNRIRVKSGRIVLQEICID